MISCHRPSAKHQTANPTAQSNRLRWTAPASSSSAMAPSHGLPANHCRVTNGRRASRVFRVVASHCPTGDCLGNRPRGGARCIWPWTWPLQTSGRWRLPPAATATAPVLPELLDQIPEGEEIGTVTARPPRSSRSARTVGHAKRTARPQSPETKPCERHGPMAGHYGNAGRDTTPATGSKQPSRGLETNHCRAMDALLESLRRAHRGK